MNEHDEVCRKDDLGRFEGHIQDQHIRSNHVDEEEKMPDHRFEDIEERPSDNQRIPPPNVSQPIPNADLGLQH